VLEEHLSIGRKTILAFAIPASLGGFGDAFLAAGRLLSKEAEPNDEYRLVIGIVVGIIAGAVVWWITTSKRVGITIEDVKLNHRNDELDIHIHNGTDYTLHGCFAYIVRLTRDNRDNISYSRFLNRRIAPRDQSDPAFEMAPGSRKVFRFITFLKTLKNPVLFGMADEGFAKTQMPVGLYKIELAYCATDRIPTPLHLLVAISTNKIDLLYWGAEAPPEKSRC